MSIINSFPGYEYVGGKNMYRGTDLGKGGYIISNPGIYGNVALLDVASLHPSSIRAMNCFGEYTKNFTDLLDARIAIKHKNFETARKMLDGKLAPYLEDESQAKDLAQALKIAINSVYGLTAANFDNPFRDIRNGNNIVALRGSLFMRTLQDEVLNRGFKIVAIKTDSIKIADANQDIIDFCMDFAKQYGYTFEFEAHYEKLCQINDADYVAKYSKHEVNGKHAGEWTVTGAKFAIPYVFKKLFSKEPIEFEDMCETKSVSTSVYIDRSPDEALEYMTHPDAYRDGADDINLDNGHSLQFVGKVGLFTPMKEGCGGGSLVRQGKDKDGNVKYDSVAGAKGYLWMESEMVDILGKKNSIDESYYVKLVDDAVAAISKYGDFEWFVSDDPYIPEIPPDPYIFSEDAGYPWFIPDTRQRNLAK